MTKPLPCGKVLLLMQTRARRHVVAFIWETPARTGANAESPRSPRSHKEVAMFRFGLNHRRTVMGLAAVITLLLSVTVAPTVFADDDQEQEFGMFANFATEQTGASGSGESEVDGDIVEIEVEAEGLLPNHQYEMKVIIGPEGDLTAPAFLPPPHGFVTCGWENSEDDGEVEFDCDLDLVELRGPGMYRLDFFVTHIHPTVAGSGFFGLALSEALDRDPLLRCGPASVHMVPADDGDSDSDSDSDSD